MRMPFSSETVPEAKLQNNDLLNILKLGLCCN